MGLANWLTMFSEGVTTFRGRPAGLHHEVFVGNTASCSSYRLLADLRRQVLAAGVRAPAGLAVRAGFLLGFA